MNYTKYTTIATAYTKIHPTEKGVYYRYDLAEYNGIRFYIRSKVLRKTGETTSKAYAFHPSSIVWWSSWLELLRIK